MTRTSRRLSAAKRSALLLACSTVMTFTACDGELGRQFREAAGNGIETGLQSILSGVLDGVFAIVEPDAQT